MLMFLVIFSRINDNQWVVFNNLLAGDYCIVSITPIESNLVTETPDNLIVDDKYFLTFPPPESIDKTDANLGISVVEHLTPILTVACVDGINVELLVSLYHSSKLEILDRPNTSQVTNTNGNTYSNVTTYSPIITGGISRVTSNG
ncbi:hypothetical protein ACTFIZ_000946 [Dictyostelium cf. discoideum]